MRVDNEPGPFSAVHSWIRDQNCGHQLTSGADRRDGAYVSGGEEGVSGAGGPGRRRRWLHLCPPGHSQPPAPTTSVRRFRRSHLREPLTAPRSLRSIQRQRWNARGILQEIQIEIVRLTRQLVSLVLEPPIRFTMHHVKGASDVVIAGTQRERYYAVVHSRIAVTDLVVLRGIQLYCVSSCRPARSHNPIVSPILIKPLPNEINGFGSQARI